MARKISDLAYSMITLSFLMSALTGIFLGFDASIGQTTPLTGDFSSLSSELDEVNDMQEQLSLQVDNATSLKANPDTDSEVRTASTSGVLNLFNKNIAINFYKLIARKFGIPAPITTFIIGLIVTTVTILVARFFFGENRT